jgi:hypothetical protein
MKVYTYFTPSHKIFFDEFFSPSVEDLEIVQIMGDQDCKTGFYYTEGWKQTTMKKVDVFIKACEDNQGSVFVFSDVDIQFFGPIKQTLLEELGDYDIALQNDYLGGMCSGFFVCRGNERTLNMFKKMKENESQYLEDQHALNLNLHLVKFKPLSEKFWTFGMFKTQWKNQNFNIPDNLLMHHANWTEGIENKTNLLKFVRQKFNLKKLVSQNLHRYQEFLYDYFEEFRPNPTYPTYPPYQTGKYLEDWFIDFFKTQKIEKEIYFLPIIWTTCYIEFVKLPLLQEKLLSLDPTKEYFAVHQHDDSIREFIPFNLKKFSVGGLTGGIPLPPTCSDIPQKYIKFQNRDIFASFVGSTTPSNMVRNTMINFLKDDSDFYLHYRTWENTVEEDRMLHFFDVCSRSTFTLCPRGYSYSSFRMSECMQFGSIPVYIYDTDWRPFKHVINWDEFSISIHYSQLSNLKTILKSIPEEKVKQMSKNCIEYYKKYFTREAVSNLIISML